ncbi:MAG: thioredoxin family protein [Deltaproteobacteria bacterium]|nr:thioredoxin family protein [Deltaproteobacteria bacterium]
MKNFLLSLGFLFFASISSASMEAASPFKVAWDGSPMAVELGQNVVANIQVTVPDGHYLYAEKFDVDFVSLEGIRIDRIEYPPPKPKWDEFQGREVGVFTEDLAIRISAHVPEDLTPGQKEVSLVLGLQGCTPNLCLRPEKREISFLFEVKSSLAIQGEASLPASGQGEFSFWSSVKNGDIGRLREKGMLWVLVVAFFGGILTSFTPCVWPLIPVILLIVGVHPEHRLRRNLTLSLSLVTGMVLVYAVLGLSAAAFGKSLGFLFQSRIFVAGIAVLFLGMSLSMFGFFEIRLPQRLQQFLHALGGKGHRGAFLAGLGTGLIASPCVGPVIGSLLTYVALQKDYGFGFLALVIFGCGIGLLFVVLGTGYATFADRLKSGPWLVWVKRLIGILLLLPALYYASSLVKFHPMEVVTQNESKIIWITDETEGLAAARSSHKPMLIDFYADWCPPCRKYDREFFSRDDISELANHFVMVRIDATHTNDEVERVADKYHVVGWPTIKLLSADGTVYENLTVHAYAPDRLEQAMREVLKR